MDTLTRSSADSFLEHVVYAPAVDEAHDVSVYRYVGHAVGLEIIRG